MCSYVKLQAASAYFVGRWVGLYTCVFRCAETVKNRYYCVSYFFAKTDGIYFYDYVERGVHTDLQAEHGLTDLRAFWTQAAATVQTRRRLIQECFNGVMSIKTRVSSCN